MTGRKKESEAKDAAEFLAQLEKDKQYQRQRAAFEADLKERADVLRKAERPILAALRRVGVQVDSVWDLVNTSEPYPAALPVLLDHLELGGYPDGVTEGLGRALAVKAAVGYWARIKALYLAPRSRGEEEGAAVALAGSATAEQLDDMIGFLSVTERGTSRIYFIRPILNLGGQRGRRLVDSLRSDPVFGEEARALLKS